MAKIVKDGSSRFWLDAKGNPVPYEYVPDQEREKDRMLRKVIKKAEKLHETIKKEKAEMVKMIKEYLDNVADKYNEDWKGNATLRGFSDDMKVEVNISERLEFDEKLQVAKKKIDKCINEWARGSSQKIRLLINKAFKVDKKGKVDKNTILSLRSLNIDDPLWEEAMDIISDSLQVSNSKEYFNFYIKDKEEYKQIPLNFSYIKAELEKINDE